MPLGIVSNDEFESEKNSLIKSNDKPKTIVDIIEPGRGKGNIEVPNGLRKVIGEESQLNGRASGLDLAKQFGISPSSVSAYANGSTSTNSYDETPNKPHINNAKARIAVKARKRLVSALNHITDEKLSETKARDLAGVAKDMAVVIKNMEPPAELNEGKNSSPTFVFYAPQVIAEDSFEKIYTRE